MIADGKFTQDFRRAVEIARPDDMEISEIERVIVHNGTPICLELIGEYHNLFLILPDHNVVRDFANTLLEQNPGIEIIIRRRMRFEE